MGIKKYTEIHNLTPWIHEEAVFKRTLATREKWSELELADAYLYLQQYADEKSYGKIKIFYQEMEELVEKLNLK